MTTVLSGDEIPYKVVATKLFEVGQLDRGQTLVPFLGAGASLAGPGPSGAERKPLLTDDERALVKKMASDFDLEGEGKRFLELTVPLAILLERLEAPG